jgi:hypothetical protein
VFQVGEISGSHGGEYEDDSSRMMSPVVSYKLTDVSEELTATHRPDDGGNKRI